MSKTFKEVCDEGGLFADMCDTLWARVKRLDDSLENGDKQAPPTMTSAQKLRLFEGTGCQSCDNHPLISFKWVFWGFGARLCQRCMRVRMVTEEVLQRDPDTLPEHYRGLPFSSDRYSALLMETQLLVASYTGARTWMSESLSHASVKNASVKPRKTKKNC